jgi:hypothetical protein
MFSLRSSQLFSVLQLFHEIAGYTEWPTLISQILDNISEHKAHSGGVRRYSFTLTAPDFLTRELVCGADVTRTAL